MSSITWSGSSAVEGIELEEHPARAGFDAAAAQPHHRELQEDDLLERLHLLRRLSVAVAELGVYLEDRLRRFCQRVALVEEESLADVLDVVFGDVRGDRNLHVRFEVLVDGLSLELGDRLLQELGIELEAHRFDVPD